MKIMIVDDSKAMRMIIAKSLKLAGFGGHEVIEATNGVEAFEKIGSESPDLVLSDWNMPEMSGIELLEKVREAGHKVRFGFITSESSSETRAMAIEKGAEFLMTKPFSADQLESTLQPFMV